MGTPHRHATIVWQNVHLVLLTNLVLQKGTFPEGMLTTQATPHGSTDGFCQPNLDARSKSHAALVRRDLETTISSIQLN